MARRSMQREAVYANLCSRTDHPTAEEVYASLKPKMPSISLATVYRNLHTLTEQGKIQTISIDKSDHFDAKVEQHYHLYCNTCGRLYDLDFPLIQGIDYEAREYKDGKINAYSLVFYGTCPHCLKK